MGMWETLTNAEVASLAKTPQGSDPVNCKPAEGTIKISMANHNKCMKIGQPYTVCFDTPRPKEHGRKLRARERVPEGPPKRQGIVHCGIYVAGVPATRVNGHVDCMGGCNEGKEACTLSEWRGGCFMHDACSITNNAAGFFSDHNCGNVAHAAFMGFGKCHHVHYVHAKHFTPALAFDYDGMIEA